MWSKTNKSLYFDFVSKVKTDCCLSYSYLHIQKHYLRFRNFLKLCVTLQRSDFFFKLKPTMDHKYKTLGSQHMIFFLSAVTKHRKKIIEEKSKVKMLILLECNCFLWFNKAYGSNFEVSLFVFFSFVSVQSSKRIWGAIIVCTHRNRGIGFSCQKYPFII